eukprot:4340563-Amphidinium_carterae.3
MACYATWTSMTKFAATFGHQACPELKLRRLRGVDLTQCLHWIGLFQRMWCTQAAQHFVKLCQ